MYTNPDRHTHTYIKNMPTETGFKHLYVSTLCTLYTQT